MNLKNFTARLTTAERDRFLELSGTTQNYLWQITGGHRQPSLRLLQTMREASKLLFPGRGNRWLTIGHMLRESEVAQRKKELRQQAELNL